MTTRLLFKVTDHDGQPFHGGRGRWPLPTHNPDGTWTPSEPMTVAGALEPCANGLHLARETDLIHWLGPVIHLVQVPERVEEIALNDKIVVRTARLERTLTTWNERTARHFACDCAERVLHLTTDPRPAEAVRIARLFADGLASRNEMAAAWAAAGDAAWDAAGAAAWDAAWAAARAAAKAAAWAAAWAAAGDAERNWQNALLMEYLRGERP